MIKRVTFRHKSLPYMLLAPQLLITLIFFIWPALQALYQSLLVEDAFGLSTQFVWFENFEELFKEMSQYGEIKDMMVIDNLGDHTIGNVYVRYSE